MFVLAGKITGRPGKQDELIQLAERLIRFTRAEKGCVSYTFYQEVNNRDEFLFFEEWDDRDALKTHLMTEHFLDFSGKVSGLIIGEPNITVYEVECTKSVAAGN